MSKQAFEKLRELEVEVEIYGYEEGGARTSTSRHKGRLSKKSASAIWQYFYREFPREAVEILTKDLIKSILENAEHIDLGKPIDILMAIDVIANNAQRFVSTLEHLWNGGETDIQDCKCSCHIENGVNFITHCPSCQPKPICPTCGGSGQRLMRIQAVPPNKEWREYEPCPDCTEKPPKCLRCGVSIYSAVACHFESGGFMEHRFVDQRKGERRKGNIWTCPKCSQRIKHGMSHFYYEQIPVEEGGGRIFIKHVQSGRRTGDERRS